MESRPFLRVRKPAWFIVLLMAVLLTDHLVPRLFHKTASPTDSPAQISAKNDLIVLELGSGWVDGKTFGVDTVFQQGRDRVYAVASGLIKSGMHTQWYLEGSLRGERACVSSSPCITSLGPDSLSAGNWSVDVVVGRHLLASRQFRVAKSETP